jgi:hypothetical protein
VDRHARLLYRRWMHRPKSGPRDATLFWRIVLQANRVGEIRYFEIIRAVDDLRIDVQIGGRATIAPPERRQMYFDM